MKLWLHQKITKSILRGRSAIVDITPTGRNGWFVRMFSGLWTTYSLYKHNRLRNRRLEIGPGSSRLTGFETLSCTWAPHIDYVIDATVTLPFSDGTFDLVYASHVLEHVPWYQTTVVLREWIRILSNDGVLELWVPDGLKICKGLVDAETKGIDPMLSDPWARYNDHHDPCVWASGRVFTYGDGTGKLDDPNWHRALFTERYLRDTMLSLGLVNVEKMNTNDVRGYDHGWINLGLRGRKPKSDT